MAEEKKTTTKKSQSTPKKTVSSKTLDVRATRNGYKFLLNGRVVGGIRGDDVTAEQAQTQVEKVEKKLGL